MNFVIESLFAGFISAIGWWSANEYVIDPYLKSPKTEQVQPAKEDPKKEVKDESVDSKDAPQVTP
jgi:hypothetical protein